MPIVMLTSYSELNQVLKARDAGSTNYLAKPVSAQRVYDLLVNLIERPRRFIVTDTYRGPDRRRKSAAAAYDGPERRGNIPAVAENPDVSLSQGELNVLMQGGDGA